MRMGKTKGYFRMSLKYMVNFACIDGISLQQRVCEPSVRDLSRARSPRNRATGAHHVMSRGTPTLTESKRAVAFILPQSTFINVQSVSRHEGARRKDLDANRTLLRQDVVVIGYEWRCRRCAQRYEFSIVSIRDHDKSVGIDGTGKLTLRPEQIRDPQPIEARNPAQDCLGLTSGRLVPDQEKMFLPNGRENARGCASAVEARRDEYVGIDHNPVHADTVL